MRIIGHRGTPTTAAHPENTLPAVSAALDTGAGGVEIDVRATSDGVLVLSHDPDLGRVLGTGPGTGPVVAATTWGELRTVPLPGGTRVPRLSEALDLVASYGAHVVTEVKAEAGADGPRTAHLLAGLLALRRLVKPGADRVVASSFDLPTARQLAGSGAVTSALILEPSVDPDSVALRARALGLAELHLSVEHARRDPGVVARLHDCGLRVGAGIVDDLEVARELAALGVDTLCTDAPAVLARALALAAAP